MLNEILQSDDEYWTMHEKMKETMEDAWISKLWRVQNQSLWTYYSFHKDRILMNGDDPQEKQVWHGTSSLDPGVIFNDLNDNEKILSINLSGTKRSNLTVVIGDLSHGHLMLRCYPTLDLPQE